MTNNSYRFFANTDCKYYPCHAGLKEINCLFCYCPLYHREDCSGEPRWKDRNGKRVKICTDCTFPHRPENYEKLMQLLKQ
ncbi:MAG: metal-binding protein [Mogibacterium sp.]|nr:metal-binding protein [Mogibacterium sp.]